MTAPELTRANIAAYLSLCRRHFLQHWKAYTMPLAAVVVFQVFFRIDINGVTHSLPDHVFITVKGWKDIHPGDYVAFEWQGGGPYIKGTGFIKILKGMPGDTVYADGERNFYLLKQGEQKGFFGGEFLGRAKTVSSKGVPLEMGPTGVIPVGAYYFAAPHPDSLDSRYALTGWVKEENILGRSFALF